MVTATQKFAAEFVGTFFLVFIGTGAIAADTFSGGAVGLLGVALALIVYSKLFLSGKEE